VLELEGEPACELDVSLHTLETRLRRLDEDGIDVAFVSCPPTLGLPPDLLDAYHEGILEMAAASQGRLLPLAAEEVLDGFLGTCVAAATVLDRKRIAPLAQELERRGLLLFVHPGPARSPAGPPSPRALAGGCRRAPRPRSCATA